MLSLVRASVGLALLAIRVASAQNLSCTAIPSTYGTIRIYETGQGTDPTFPPDGEPVGLGPVKDAGGTTMTTVEIGDTDTEAEFFECDSAYMGYTSGANQSPGVYHYYGQIRLVDSSGPSSLCLTVQDPGINNLITLSTCSETDDVSQTLQTWYIIQNMTSLAPAPITFIGNVTYRNPPHAGYFQTYISDYDGAQIVNQTFQNGLNPKTLYQMYIETST